MIQKRTHLTAARGHAACLGILVCAMVCGVMAAGCSSLPVNTTLPSFEEDIVITTGAETVGRNFASCPVTIENKGILSVADIHLQADLLDVTGGGETILASQEIDAGSYDPGEVRTVNVDFKLIKLTGKDVRIRVTRME
ncbi:DUF4382 domain-containing protein [Methanogenium sp. MK-MG]|uniref:DUF4382 domain-containing protein n=1 Tax=Methanogenium sp. MK-MG TaxID=2599926 RepID=UPI0013EBF869|nr:DUF4382 domain-containing protein [Methanogenium sp. MK-MG]KAF1078531.1 hypothetical protein MKMG_00589 [Methanogenium sp. MK-MG]